MYKKLINIIACPICKNKLVYNKKKLICIKDKISFSIRKGIPNLIIGKAKSVNKKNK